MDITSTQLSRSPRLLISNFVSNDLCKNIHNIKIYILKTKFSKLICRIKKIIRKILGKGLLKIRRHVYIGYVINIFTISTVYTIFAIRVQFFYSYRQV